MVAMPFFERVTIIFFTLSNPHNLRRSRLTRHAIFGILARHTCSPTSPMHHFFHTSEDSVPIFRSHVKSVFNDRRQLPLSNRLDHLWSNTHSTIGNSCRHHCQL